METKKRGPGRPKSTNKTRLISTRVHPDVANALAYLASIGNRSTSAQLGVTAESVVIENEDCLRADGVWTDAIERLKHNRNAVSE